MKITYVSADGQKIIRTFKKGEEIPNVIPKSISYAEAQAGERFYYREEK